VRIESLRAREGFSNYQGTLVAHRESRSTLDLSIGHNTEANKDFLSLTVTTSSH
jgi:hypothetical protein